MTQTQPAHRNVRPDLPEPEGSTPEAIQKKSLYSFGGTCAILAGICYTLMGLTYFFDPTVRTRTHKDYWQALHKNPLPHILGHFFFGLGSLFTIGTLPAIAQLVRPANEAWVRWTTSIAHIGYAALALFSFRSVAIDRGRAKDYLEGDNATKVAVVHGGKYLDEYDPNGYLQCGGVGLWLMVVSVLARRHNLLPKRLTQLGMLGAVLQWTSMLGLMLNFEPFIAISAMGAVIVAPTFLIWLGTILRRKAA
jgi:Domain of unknown function (DUF4386)